MPDTSSAAAEDRLTELFSAHHRTVVAYVARRTRPVGDQALAQDVAADVFALAWQRLSDPAGSEARPLDLPWLLVAAGNVLSQRGRDDARRWAREERVTTDRALGAPGTAAGADPADAVALNEQVGRALDRLDPGDREVLLLRVWDELPFADVAAVLGCSTGAARVRWLRARRRFAEALTREDGDPDPGPAPPPARTTRTSPHVEVTWEAGDPDPEEGSTPAPGHAARTPALARISRTSPHRAAPAPELRTLEPDPVPLNAASNGDVR